jgi:proteasome lid subunit RPN8/RPN11
MLVLTRSAAAAIATHAEQTYPDECVGLLLGMLEADGIKRVLQVVAVENRWSGQVQLAESDNAESRRDRFYLDPRDYLRADRAASAAGLEIVGCYHSHPDHPAIPSERDRVGAQGVGGGTSFAFAIQSVVSGQATDLASWLLLDAGERFAEEAVTVVE